MTEKLLTGTKNQNKKTESVIHLQIWAYGSWDSLFPISMSPTENLWVQNTIFNDKSAYYCILWLAEIKPLHPRDKIMCKRCRMHREQNHGSIICLLWCYYLKVETEMLLSFGFFYVSIDYFSVMSVVSQLPDFLTPVLPIELSSENIVCLLCLLHIFKHTPENWPWQ